MHYLYPPISNYIYCLPEPPAFINIAFIIYHDIASDFSFNIGVVFFIIWLKYMNEPTQSLITDQEHNE